MLLVLRVIAEILAESLQHYNPMVSFVSKLMNKLISERDYSAQEIYHILLGLALQEDSQVVQSVRSTALWIL